MDYVYAQINQEAVKNTYIGVSTPTADVTVDNSNNTIKVDAFTDEPRVKELITDELALLEVKDSGSGFVTEVSQTAGKISVSKKELSSDDLPADIPQEKIKDLPETLSDLYATKQDNLFFAEMSDKMKNKVGKDSEGKLWAERLTFSVEDGETLVIE